MLEPMSSDHVPLQDSRWWRIKAGFLFCVVGTMVATPSLTHAQRQSVFGVGGGYQVSGNLEPEPVAAAILQIGFGTAFFLGYGFSTIVDIGERADSLGPVFRDMGHGPLADIYPGWSPKGWQPHVQAGYQWNRTRLEVDESNKSWESVIAGVGVRRGGADFILRGNFPQVDDRPNYFTLELHLGCRCGAGSPTQQVASTELLPNSADLTAIGDLLRLGVSAWDKHGDDVFGAETTWYSRNQAVATVDSQGVVVAVGNGTTRIVAMTGAAVGEMIIKVAQEPAALSVNPAAVNLRETGHTIQLRPTILDRSAELVPGASVSWTSANPSVAAVSATGLVTAVGGGTVEVIARSGNASARVRVVVEHEPVTVEIPSSPPTLQALGETADLRAIVRDKAGKVIANASVQWSSSSSDVVIVDTDGLALARKNGVAQIAARIDDAVAFVAVTVQQRPASIDVTPTYSVVHGMGEEIQLEAVVRDRGGAIVIDAPVQWASSAPEVVSVDTNGLATPRAPGEARVTVTSGTASYVVRITVEESTTSRTAKPGIGEVGTVGESGVDHCAEYRQGRCHCENV